MESFPLAFNAAFLFPYFPYQNQTPYPLNTKNYEAIFPSNGYQWNTVCRTNFLPTGTGSSPTLQTLPLTGMVDKKIRAGLPRKRSAEFEDLTETLLSLKRKNTTVESVKKTEEEKRKRKRRKVKYCSKQGCNKYAQGKTDFCVSHGGGKRCTFPNCKTGARGATDYCIFHGGGNRCQHEDCTRSAVGKTLFCIRHGGGRRCATRGCRKSAQGASCFCVRHGGGRKCEHEGCLSIAASFSKYCKHHNKRVTEKEEEDADTVADN